MELKTLPENARYLRATGRRWGKTGAGGTWDIDEQGSGFDVKTIVERLKVKVLELTLVEVEPDDDDDGEDDDGLAHAALEARNA
jgi:hypothetical protein